MEYSGKLYARLDHDKYVELKNTSIQFDKMLEALKYLCDTLNKYHKDPYQEELPETSEIESLIKEIKCNC